VRAMWCGCAPSRSRNSANGMCISTFTSLGTCRRR
jgi:hypothetical protein